MQVDLSIFSKAQELTRAVMPHVSPDMKELLKSEARIMNFFSENPDVNTRDLADDVYGSLTNDMKRLVVLFSSVSLNESIKDPYSTAPESLKLLAKKVREHGLASIADALGIIPQFSLVVNEIIEIARMLESEKSLRKVKPYVLCVETCEVLLGGVFAAWDQAPKIADAVLKKLVISRETKNEKLEVTLQLRCDEALFIISALKASLDCSELDEDSTKRIKELEPQAMRDIEDLRNLFKDSE